MDLKDKLLQDNPWWTKENQRIQTPDYERKIVDEIEKDEPFSMILFGPRQTGKTTIFQQVINRKLEEGDNDLVYAAMDRFPGSSLNEVIEAYKEINGRTQGTYFFDEVHNVKNWSSELKSLVDSAEEDKFYATGSSSVVLLGKSAESGIGRFKYHHIPPFTFSEYCSYNGINERISNVFDLQDENEAKVRSHYNETKPLLSRYQLWGGFPSQFNLDYSLGEWHDYLRQNYVSLTIYKDILSYFEVRDPSILEDILFLISEKTGLPLSYTSISNSFNISFEALRNYIHYLEASGLIIVCEYYSKNVLKRKRRNKKFYIADPGLNSALRYKEILDDRFMSLNIELTIANDLKNYLRKNTGLINPKLTYWKDKYEVDFVIEIGGDVRPIEVKFKEEIKGSDLKGILSFMDENELEQGWVVSKSDFERREIEGHHLDFIPASVFLSAPKY